MMMIMMVCVGDDYESNIHPLPLIYTPAYARPSAGHLSICCDISSCGSGGSSSSSSSSIGQVQMCVHSEAVDLLYSLFMHPSSSPGSKYRERYGLNGPQATLHDALLVAYYQPTIMCSILTEFIQLM